MNAEAGYGGIEKYIGVYLSLAVSVSQPVTCFFVWSLKEQKGRRK